MENTGNTIMTGLHERQPKGRPRGQQHQAEALTWRGRVSGACVVRALFFPQLITVDRARAPLRRLHQDFLAGQRPDFVTSRQLTAASH